MRVLHIINDLRVGGAERLLCDLAPRLREAGVVDVALLADTPSFLRDGLAASGVRIILPPHPLPLRSPRQVGWLSRLMTGYDLVHVQLFPAQLWVSMAARRLPRQMRPRLVTTEQNTHNRRRKPVFRPIETWMYAPYDRIIAITDATADALADWIPATRSRTTIIPNAADVSRFAHVAAPADRAALGIPAHATLLTCVGRLEEQKDHATLIRAMGRLPETVHAAFVGGGVLEEGLRAQAASLGVGERVHFLGRRSDIPEILTASDMYVQPSRWEGFGIAVVEAMAAGLPVVISDVAGVREVVGAAGLRFPVGDDAALATQVSGLINDPARRADLISQGRARAQDFTIERCVNTHVALYQQLLGK